MKGFLWWSNKRDEEIDDDDDDIDPVSVVTLYRQEREALVTKVLSGATITKADFKDCRGFGIATYLARDIETQSLLFREVIRLHAQKKIRAPQAVALLEAGSARIFSNERFSIARLLDKPVLGNRYAGVLVLTDRGSVTQIWPPPQDSLNTG